MCAVLLRTGMALVILVVRGRSAGCRFWVGSSISFQETFLGHRGGDAVSCIEQWPCDMVNLDSLSSLGLSHDVGGA